MGPSNLEFRVGLVASTVIPEPGTLNPKRRDRLVLKTFFWKLWNKEGVNWMLNGW